MLRRARGPGRVGNATGAAQMQIIATEARAARAAAQQVAAMPEAMAGVVAAIGNAGFAQSALAQLNRWMPMCWWSIYRLFNDAPPTIHANGSFGVDDGTAHCWQVYRQQLYRHDQTFHAARERLSGPTPLLVHWDAREIPAEHRAQIYDRHGLRERLSIVSADEGDALLAINLYRHRSQAAFSDDEIDAVAATARLLLACVQRHLAASRPDVMQGLTPREREVCERMLKGWTYDGIAADLGLSAATVKTYRDRAFDRLGIHHRNELFALVAGGLAA